MPKALPPQPNIDWLKKAAKERLAQLRERAPSAKLHEAQLAVANDYGFASWRALKAGVDALGLHGQVITAAVAGDAQTLERLITEDPRKLAITGGPWNRPLLQLAAGGGHLDCVKALLRLGFDIDRRDRLDNATALHWAAYSGHLDVVKHLLAAGADIDGEDDEHELNVIGWATCFREVHTEVAEHLLALGAKPTIFAAVALGRDDLVRALLVDNPTLLRTHKMSRFEKHRSALHLAVLKNRPDMVRLLVELGADASAEDDQGTTPLGLANASTDASISKMLIAAGADPKERAVNRFESAVPILNVRDVTASIAYYVEKLGFEKEWDWGNPPSFGCVFRDQVRIFLCKDGQGSPGTWISIFVQDVDALYEDYKQRGAIIREPPENYPWGLREMNVEDPDGHCLRVGSEGRG
jgi:ankyrin repeat protein